MVSAAALRSKFEIGGELMSWLAGHRRALARGVEMV